MEFPPKNGALEKGISGVNCVYDWKSFGSSLYCLLAFRPIFVTAKTIIYVVFFPTRNQPILYGNLRKFPLEAQHIEP